MEGISDCAAGSTSHPPFLDDKTNYASWKAKMKAFLWAKDVAVWAVIESGWEYPTKTEKVDTKEIGEGSSTVEAKVKKPMSEWTIDENTKSTNNQKALNSIFTAVSSDKFQLISHCYSAKQAWDILQVTHEGTTAVRESKLQQLIQQFENMKMGDDDKFADFYARLSVVVNGCFNLGDPIPQHRIVKKILRSLPMKYHSKKIAIQESKDLNTYNLQELIGNLTTYEMELPDEMKSKSIALKVKKDIEDESTDEEDADEDEIDLVTRKFRKFLKDRKFKRSESRFDSSSKNTRIKEKPGNKVLRFERAHEKRNNNAPKCFACEGFGHIASDCANTLKKSKNKRNKAMNVTWSDSEDDSMLESNYEVVALVGLTTTGDESEVEEFDLEEVMQQYIMLSEASKELKKRNLELSNEVENLKTNISRTEAGFQSQLEAGDAVRKSLVEDFQSLQQKYQERCEKVEELKTEKACLLYELEKMKAKAGCDSSSGEKLESILMIGKKFGDKHGLGYDVESSSKGEHVTKFVKSSDHSSSQSTFPVLEEARPMLKNFVLVCYHCGKRGHIRPRCNQLRRNSWNDKKPLMNKKKEYLQEKLEFLLKEVNKIARFVSVPFSPMPKMKQVWIRKEPHLSKLPHIGK
ncbi:uncharacterized protein LOC133711490 [Rosa rugosa]|uniref:uncharacterized protein LOC133711490 n=1 Tax=Rosa rugosa TaxID=74645 RepID=UPI002B416337|nr:uncharacterized protein LOC133711490 [Rosa rugosa]